MAEDTPPVKKVTRKRSTKQATSQIEEDGTLLASPKSLHSSIETFTELVNNIVQHQSDFENLLKQIEETKQSWLKEQKQHEAELAERNFQEELRRQHEQGEYGYEMARARQRAEDEFNDKKAAWERELRDRKEAIENDRRGLEELRTQVASFENEKDKAIKEAQAILQKDLVDKFQTERKLREQEVKSEIEVLNLRINSLTSENSRQAQEIETLKKAFDDATKQVKEIAVKVIEARGNVVKSASAD